MSSHLESLRVHRAVTGALIAYGIAAFTWLFSRTLPQQASDSTANSALVMVAIGLAIQAGMFIIRKLLERYERQHGLQGALAPVVLFVMEIVLDGVTVLLFAIATFRSIALFPAEL